MKFAEGHESSWGTRGEVTVHWRQKRTIPVYPEACQLSLDNDSERLVEFKTNFLGLLAQDFFESMSRGLNSLSPGHAYRSIPWRLFEGPLFARKICDSWQSSDSQNIIELEDEFLGG